MQFQWLDALMDLSSKMINGKSTVGQYSCHKVHDCKISHFMNYIPFISPQHEADCEYALQMIV